MWWAIADLPAPMRIGPWRGSEDGLRSDLIDPAAVAGDRGRIVKRTGDGALVEFRSVVDAVRCAIGVQNGMVERNTGLRPEREVAFQIGIHLGDVVEESDGDLMGDGVDIAARLEGIPRRAPSTFGDAYRQVKSRLDLTVGDLGETQLKNIPEPVRVFSLEIGKPAQAKPVGPPKPTEVAGPPRLSIVVLPFADIGGDPEQEYFVDGVAEKSYHRPIADGSWFVIAPNTAFTYKGKPIDLKQLGRDLGVRYVLEGSAQRGGNRLASMCSSSMPRPATVGPSGSTNRWLTCSICRMKSLLTSPIS